MGMYNPQPKELQEDSLQSRGQDKNRTLQYKKNSQPFKEQILQDSFTRHEETKQKWTHVVSSSSTRKKILHLEKVWP